MFNDDYGQIDLYHHQEPQHEPETPLEAICTYGLAGTGMTALTFLVRMAPALMPFYGIGILAALVGLGLAARLSRRVTPLAIALVIAAGAVAGHWDGITYQAQKTAQQAQEAIDGLQH